MTSKNELKTALNERNKAQYTASILNAVRNDHFGLTVSQISGTCKLGPRITRDLLKNLIDSGDLVCNNNIYTINTGTAVEDTLAQNTHSVPAEKPEPQIIGVSAINFFPNAKQTTQEITHILGIPVNPAPEKPISLSVDEFADKCKDYPQKAGTHEGKTMVESVYSILLKEDNLTVLKIQERLPFPATTNQIYSALSKMLSRKQVESTPSGEHNRKAFSIVKPNTESNECSNTPSAQAISHAEAMKLIQVSPMERRTLVVDQNLLIKVLKETFDMDEAEVYFGHASGLKITLTAIREVA